MRVQDLILLFFIILALSSDMVSSIGISPPRILIENAARDEIIEKTVYLSDIGKGEEIRYDISEDMKEWITLDPPHETAITKDYKKLPVKISIKVPKETPNGVYSSDIIISSVKVQKSKKASSVAIVPGVRLMIDITVDDKEIIDYEIRSVSAVSTVEDEPLAFRITVKNNGNVNAGPDEMQIYIRDKDDITVFHSIIPITDLAPPHKTTDLMIDIPAELGQGNYVADITILDDGRIKLNESIVIQIIKDSVPELALEKIAVPAIIFAGDMMKMTATAENQGKKTVTAVFRGELLEKDRIIDIFESEKVTIRPGETKDITAYIKDMKDGNLSVVGYISYDGYTTEKIQKAVISKKTNDRISGSMIAELMEKMSNTPVSPLMIAAIIIVQIVIVAVAIRTRK